LYDFPFSQKWQKSKIDYDLGELEVSGISSIPSCSFPLRNGYLAAELDGILFRDTYSTRIYLLFHFERWGRWYYLRGVTS